MLDCIEHTPGSPPTGSVIWLHGLGASGHDFVPILPHLDLPNVRFVFPHATPIPVTINGGMTMPAWYDIRSMERGPGREDPEGIRTSHTAIEALIARENERGVPTDRIVLAGFSQGAAMTLHTGLRHNKKLAGLLVLSGYPLLVETWSDELAEANRTTPIFHAHGTHDEMVPLEGGRKAEALAKEHGDRKQLFREYRMGHEVNAPEIRDIAIWLREHVG